MTVREIPHEQRAEAAAEACAWGYPREISWFEQFDGYWVRNEYGIAWFVRGIRAGDWLLHGIMHPAGPRRIRREVYEALRVISGLIGAKRLYVMALSFREDMKERIEKLCRHLERSGYFPGRDDLGVFMELGA